MLDINEIEQKLQEFEDQIALPAYQEPGDESELLEYLTMDRETITKFDREGRNLISFRLQQFSFHIARTHNRNLARLNRFKTELARYSAKGLTQYNNYLKYDERQFLFISDDSYAERISNLIITVQERIDRLQGLSHQLESLAQLMKNLAYSTSEKV